MTDGFTIFCGLCNSKNISVTYYSFLEKIKFACLDCGQELFVKDFFQTKKQEEFKGECVSERTKVKHSHRDRFLSKAIKKCPNPKCMKFDLIPIKKENKEYDFCLSCNYKSKKRERK